MQNKDNTVQSKDDRYQIDEEASEDNNTTSQAEDGLMIDINSGDESVADGGQVSEPAPDDEFDPHADLPDESIRASTSDRNGSTVTDSALADVTSPQVTVSSPLPIPNSPKRVQSQLPYIHDRVGTTADRSILSIYGTEQTEQQLTAVENAFDRHFESEDVAALDVREAIILAGLRNLNTAGQILKLWGYGMRSE